MKGVKSVRRAGRWLRSRRQHRGLILLYHRVAAVTRDPFAACVSPELFAAHMAALRQIGTALTLEEMTAFSVSGCLPARAIAVTFDDGYLDNLTYALPILEQYKIPATIFAVAGAIGSQFWWDQLAQAVYGPAQLPGQLQLIIGGRSHQWLPEDTKTGRERLLRSLQRRLRPLTAYEQAPILEKLRAWSGTMALEDPDERPLTQTELAALAGSSYISVGAHSLTHPSLAALPPAQQAEEIQRSKSKLEAMIRLPVTAFSYPYGMPADFTTVTADLVAQAGFRCACTNVVDVVRSGSDHFQLPRYWVRNWEADEFRRRLLHWL